MNKCALLYLVVGVTITTASYAFFLNMPSQMMQMGQQMIMPQQMMCPPCECKSKN